MLYSLTACIDEIEVFVWSNFISCKLVIMHEYVTLN